MKEIFSFFILVQLLCGNCFNLFYFILNTFHSYNKFYFLSTGALCYNNAQYYRKLSANRYGDSADQNGLAQGQFIANSNSNFRAPMAVNMLNLFK